MPPRHTQVRSNFATACSAASSAPHNLSTTPSPAWWFLRCFSAPNNYECCVELSLSVLRRSTTTNVCARQEGRTGSKKLRGTPNGRTASNGSGHTLSGTRRRHSAARRRGPHPHPLHRFTTILRERRVAATTYICYRFRALSKAVSASRALQP